MARCLMCVLLVALTLLPLFLPPHCHAYPLSLAKFLQRHRRTLHHLSQIRRRDSWDDGFSNFEPPIAPQSAQLAPFQSKDSDFDPFIDSDGPFDDGFGDVFDPADDGWGDFVDTGGFGDFDDGDIDTDFGGFADEGFGRFLETPGDDGFGSFVDLPPISSQTFSEKNEKEGQHNSFVPSPSHVKGFNSVLPSRRKGDSKHKDWSKHSQAYRGLHILEKVGIDIFDSTESRSR
ncbi:uncharacterized protein LOC100376837 [Saccoglossus kowalevskii]|uniref:Uncharacterized protein LOC100376837 n=1 Tax=Saccoglossus kowalevskii TaxID=10224 RepID=A0ABM0GX59_SACKO|nr:PREDICTED: uncharacterized protein LOC100376837 [Saccoglossus kowalevskii]